MRPAPQRGDELLEAVERDLDVVVDDEEDGDEGGEREEDERADGAEHLLHPPGHAKPDVATPEGQSGTRAVGEPAEERRGEERDDDGEAAEEREEDRRPAAEEDVAPRAEDEGEEHDGVAEKARDQPVGERRADEAERVLGLVAARVERVDPREGAGEGVVGRVVGDERERQQEGEGHEDEPEHLFLALTGDEGGVALGGAPFLAFSRGASRGSAHVGGRSIRREAAGGGLDSRIYG